MDYVIVMYFLFLSSGDEWDLTQHVHRIPVAESPIHCFCPVDKELWIGVVNCCVIMNMETLRLEVHKTKF